MLNRVASTALILLTLFNTPVFACSNYDECMERATRVLETRIDCSSGHCWTWVEIDDRQASYNKAISFRLDEIYKEIKNG